MTTLAATPPPAASSDATAPFPTQRLASVDALRGFDMFWIMGADSLAVALHKLSPNGPTSVLADQLEHADWQGFHFYDLIFPLFVFLAGVSIVFSLSKTIATVGQAEAVKRVIRRGILLFIIGIIYSGGFSNGWPDMRLMGVLNRIALAYMFAGLFFCFFKPRGLVAICAGLLIGYWSLMSFTPIRDIQLTRHSIARLAREAGDTETADYFANSRSPNPSTEKNSPAWAGAEKLFYATTNRVTGKFDKGYNLSDHFDFQHLPGKKYDTFFDPEGFLSTIPAIATCLLGVFAGFLLRLEAPSKLRINSIAGGVIAACLCLVNSYARSHSFLGMGLLGVLGSLLLGALVAWLLILQADMRMRKVSILVTLGITAALLGWLFDLQFPVIKKIWTSSYVLVAGGYSAVFLGVFYLIVDVWKKQAWCQPFIWMGMNSITVYLASNLMGGGGWRKLATRFVGGDVRTFLDDHVTAGLGDTVLSIFGLVLAFWFVHFLYQRKIFLRL